MRTINIHTKRHTMFQRDVINFDEWDLVITNDPKFLANLLWGLYKVQQIDHRGQKYVYQYTIKL